ncbi:zinc knuckle CX2CX4HX4C containing protein [Tanacetum coccineum]|uniref:Zinc knuckle CX2CX4HX4C containing protein n=1 Tax=Tanacetum coccineum TaxID=301880 RepID=A0ABQ4ZXK5_9ASTR
MIRNSFIILKKWTINTSPLKEELTRIPIWVKIHDIPLQVFSEDGISPITTKFGKPIMLDSYTSSMCIDSWGRSSFARCLIEIKADDVLKEIITMGILLLDGYGFSKETNKPPKVSVLPASSSGSPNGMNGGITFNIPVSNPYVVLNEESEEDVENVFDKSVNLLSSAKTGACTSTYTVSDG